VWLPAVAGAALGALYAGLNRAGMRRFWRAPREPLCVVITGGTKGIGKALAREFLQCDMMLDLSSCSPCQIRCSEAPANAQQLNRLYERAQRL